MNFNELTCYCKFKWTFLPIHSLDFFLEDFILRKRLLYWRHHYDIVWSFIGNLCCWKMYICQSIFTVFAKSSYLRIQNYWLSRTIKISQNCQLIPCLSGSCHTPQSCSQYFIRKRDHIPGNLKRIIRINR